MKYTRYEFDETELTLEAFKVYSNSSFVFYKSGGAFYYSDNPVAGEKVELGTIEDVNEFLEMFV